MSDKFPPPGVGQMSDKCHFQPGTWIPVLHCQHRRAWAWVGVLLVLASGLFTGWLMYMILERLVDVNKILAGGCLQ